MAQRIRFSLPGQQLQACDICYARKVKCDRQRECKNCSLAQVPCNRSRLRRPRRPGVNQSLSSTEVQSTLRQVEKSPGCVSPARSIQNNSALMSHAPSPQPHRQIFDQASDLRGEEGQEKNTTACSSAPEDASQNRAVFDLKSSDQTDDARILIRQELESNVHLSLDRVQVLEAALSLVTNFDHASQQADNRHHDPAPDDDDTISSNQIPHELFYMMLNRQPGHNNQYYLHWPDHITYQTLERMCVALANNTVTGQQALQYRLCVFAKATGYAKRRLRLYQSTAMSDSLEKSSQKYAAAGLRCLREIDFMTSPNLLTLQSLLAGAILRQLLGDASRAWVLIAFASRLLVALGYHTLTLDMLANDQTSEVRDCIYWCYYMDKTLSMLLVRPSSLPDMRFEPATLVYTELRDPLTLKVKVLVKLAHVQDVSLSLLLRDRKHDMTNTPAAVECLRFELNGIREEILQVRAESINIPGIKVEWDAVDFTFFSILTTVLRLDSSSFHNHAKREECLLYARKALLSMRTLKDHISSSTRVATDFLFWTILLYPLTPFFVVFCNVVATSNSEDLELLEETTAAISGITEQCSFARNLHNLFTQFINLCLQLQDIQTGQASYQAERPQLPTFNLSHPPISNEVSKDHSVGMESGRYQNLTEEVASHSMSQLHTQAPAYGVVEPGLKSGSIWDDGLMWELFDTQPSIEWFDSNF